MTLPPLCAVDSASLPLRISTPYLVDDSDKECVSLTMECISQKSLLIDYLNKLSGTTPDVTQVSLVERPRDSFDFLHWSSETGERSWALQIDEDNVIFIHCDKRSEEIVPVVSRIIGTLRSSASNW